MVRRTLRARVVRVVIGTFPLSPPLTSPTWLSIELQSPLTRGSYSPTTVTLITTCPRDVNPIRSDSLENISTHSTSALGPISVVLLPSVLRPLPETLSILLTLLESRKSKRPSTH